LHEEEPLSQLSRERAFVAKEPAEEATRQAWHRTPVVRIAWGQTDGKQLAPIVDHQVEFEAVEPPHRRLPTAGINGKDVMLLDAGRMAHGERGGVDETDPRTLPQLCVQVDRQRHEIARHESHEAGITQEGRKLLAQLDLDVLGGEAFACPIPRLLEHDEDRQDLGRMQPRRASPLACATAQQLALPLRLEAVPKGIHRTEQVEYTHTDTSSRADGL
jgi:hypothetical protein